MSIISKTNKDIKVLSVEFDDIDGDVTVITEDGDNNKHEWTVQTNDGAYNYSDGCLLFVDGIEFDYSWQGEDWDNVFEHHLAVVVNAANDSI